MQEMNLEEFLETEASSETEGFQIDSDDKAEWALRKIREHPGTAGDSGRGAGQIRRRAGINAVRAAG